MKKSVLACLIPMAAAVASGDSITPIMYNGNPVQPDGVSNDGSRVLVSGAPNAIWRRSGGWVNIPDLAQTVDTHPLALSGDGMSVVGNAYSLGAFEVVGFRWTAGTGTVPLGSGACSGEAANGNGSVLVGVEHGNPFVWNSGTMLDLPVLGSAEGVSNNGGVVAGTMGPSDGTSTQAFIWTSVGGLTPLTNASGATYGQARGLSGDGSTVVGYVTLSGGVIKPMMWTAGTGETLLGVIPGDTDGQATAASEDGSTVVGSDLNRNGAFIWTLSGGTRSLLSFLNGRGTNLAGWTALDAVTGMSPDATHIVGIGVYNGQEQGFIADLNPVPEPASTVTLCSGVLLLALRKRRRA